jgi:hypothetical protein
VSGVNFLFLSLAPARLCCRRVLSVTVDLDAYTAGPYDKAWDALEDLADTVPTTVVGLLALVLYTQELRDSNEENFLSEFDAGRRLITTLATAAKALMNPIA